ncbi:MAG: hypothetical protein KDJ38_11740 [Gammaproteobacteria bacterium]|nr:hypothetical protein [Gammaproteobacteria bacterium]
MTFGAGAVYADWFEPEGDGLELVDDVRMTASLELQTATHQIEKKQGGLTNETDYDYSLDLSLEYAVHDRLFLEASAEGDDAGFSLDELALSASSDDLTIGWHHGNREVCVCDTAFVSEPLVQLGTWRGDALYLENESDELSWRISLLGDWFEEDKTRQGVDSLRVELHQDAEDQGPFWQFAWQNSGPGDETDWPDMTREESEGAVYALQLGWLNRQNYLAGEWLRYVRRHQGDIQALSLEYLHRLTESWTFGARLEGSHGAESFPERRYGMLAQWRANERLQLGIVFETGVSGQWPDLGPVKRYQSAYLTLTLTI